MRDHFTNAKTKVLGSKATQHREPIPAQPDPRAATPTAAQTRRCLLLTHWGMQESDTRTDLLW